MKKNKDQISSYYSNASAVGEYDRRRFSGTGGNYIHEMEVSPILSMIALLPYRPVILELGAGRGRLTRHLLTLSESIKCLELSKEMIAHLSQVISKRNILNQSIFEKPNTNATFNVITSLRFFEHFSLPDQEKILDSVDDSLVTNGVIIYSNVNKYSLEGLFSKFFPYGRYNYFYSRNEIERLFWKHGYALTSSDGRFFIPRGAFLYIKSKLLLSLLKSFDTIASHLLPRLCSYQVLQFVKVS